MKILQLCFFVEDYWNNNHQVESWDIKNGKDIMTLPDHYGREFDLILSAPPCTQFTKANQHNWLIFPAHAINIAKKCLKISIESNKPFIFETVPGRLEKFIPELIPYRSLTWMSSITGKQHILYSNFILLMPYRQKGNQRIVRNKTKREQWQPDLVNDISTIIETTTFTYK